MTMPASTFEEFLRGRTIEGEWDVEWCTQCGARDQLTADGYCATCLRGLWTAEQVAHDTATAIIGATVKGALEAGISAQTIGLAVSEALS
jgi:hypothetical protein